MVWGRRAADRWGRAKGKWEMGELQVGTGKEASKNERGCTGDGIKSLGERLLVGFHKRVKDEK